MERIKRRKDFPTNIIINHVSNDNLKKDQRQNSMTLLLTHDWIFKHAIIKRDVKEWLKQN